MKIDRALAAAALVLASSTPHAYQIVEGRYRVEVSPGVFQDQLVIRCDDGRTMTVPWETKLAAACNESLMGEPLPRAAVPPKLPSAAPADPVQSAAKPAPVPAPVAAAIDAAAIDPAPPSLLDEQAQKGAMLAQVRAQFGNVPEHYIEFKPGADGLSMRFLPPLSDILKKYETCRRAHDLSADCGGERDRALAKLSDSAAQSGTVQSTDGKQDSKQHKASAPAQQRQTAVTNAPAQQPQTAVTNAPAQQPQTAVTNAPAQQPQTAVTNAPAQPPRSAAVATPPVQSESARQAVQPPAAKPDRAAAEEKIGKDYALCMRAKPKFECEQTRTKALSELERPKAGKTKRTGRQAATTPDVAAAH